MQMRVTLFLHCHQSQHPRLLVILLETERPACSWMVVVSSSELVLNHLRRAVFSKKKVIEIPVSPPILQRIPDELSLHKLEDTQPFSVDFI